MCISNTLAGRETKTEIKPIDTIGLVLLVVGVGALQIMLDQGKELDWFNSTEIIVLTIIAVVALSFLIVWELTDEHPVIDLSLFKSRNFTIGCLTLSLAYMIYFGTIVLLPLLLQEVFGYTATWAGLAAASVGLLPLIITPIIGKFGGKVDLRYIISFSFIMFAVCFYWRAYTFEPGMDFATVAWPQFWQGLGVACFFMPLTTMTLSGLPPEKMASASSLSNFLRTLAGAIGASLTTTIWTQRESLHHETFVEKINPLDPDAQLAFQQMRELGLSDEQTSAYLAKTITEQGLIISANEIFWLAAGIFILMLVVVWFAKPPFSPGK